MSSLYNGLPDVNSFYRQYNSELTGRKSDDTDQETVGPTPTDTRTNANDVQQSGRNLSKLSVADATDYLQRSTKGYVQGFGPNTFLGTQLPTAIGNPYAGDPALTPGFDMTVPDIGGANAVNFDRDGGVAAVQTNDLTDNVPFTGKEQRIEGASTRREGGSLSDALADTAGINSYMQKFSNGDPALARRAAFLDAPDTLSGMKAVKAQQNMMSLGTKDYMANGDSMVEIDGQDMRDRLAGRMSAKDLTTKYVKDSSSDTPAQSQDPLTTGAQAVKAGFTAGAQTDFALNNGSIESQNTFGGVVPPEIIENYDFSKPGAEEAYFGKGGILDRYTKK